MAIENFSSRGKNCLRYSNLPETLTVRTDIKPGQLYDADTQCQMMHGHGYKQVKPRQDHYDGICYMMWCGKSTFGRIITSHPALEGTFCGHNKWCELGRCVAWPGDSGAESAATAPKRVDGGWSEWSRPSCSSCSCSSLFGSIGVTLSTRSCSNPTPANGGAECIGSSVRALVCNRKCPSAWKSVDRYIADKCDERKREKNDKELTGTGSQLKRYPQRACKIFCDVESKYGSQRNYRFFGDNLPDGTLCGRNRYCLDGECLPMSCDDTALINRDQSCPQERCPLTIPTKKYAGEWGSWSLWSFCSQTCGGGFRERTRSCRRGRCDGTTKESEACEVQSCPSQTAGGSSWSEWTPWNQCSVTCGKGSQARYRRCTTSENSIARDCPGSTMDIRPCDKGTCETGQVGLWGTWTEWSTCSTTCGPGIQTRNRYCTKEPCDGSGQARMSCNLGPCSEGASEWQEWSAWSQCSRLCGKGLRTRKRKCHGNNCVGSAAEQQICNETPCTGSTGQWSNWSSWGSCSVTCGAGVKRRTRHCQYGNCPGSYKESAICGLQSCGDATWGGWGYWSTCSETCGRGVRKRVRKCYGTGHCSGSEYERESCYNRPC
ncbi:hypothetical protein AB6A40_004626 [Gnathostoma spinigerum]|uniref:Uncharacterized protein n=1 Tax=Gnathostoma spinigerum TaxID=75299 RepID=A0ABD6EMX8_9BILA